MTDTAYSRLDVDDTVKDGTQGYASAVGSSRSGNSKYQAVSTRYCAGNSKRRGYLIIAGIGLVILCSLWIMTRRRTTLSQESHLSYDNRPWIEPGLLPDLSKVMLHKEPQESFRDNLVPSVNYALTSHIGGWTNQIMCDVNLILYAMRTDRVPVLLPFEPSQVGTTDAGFLWWSDVFDMDMFQRLIHHPVLQWDMLQRTREHTEDKDASLNGHLMCWESRSHWGGNDWFFDQHIGLEAWPLPADVNERLGGNYDWDYTTFDRVTQFLDKQENTLPYLRHMNETWETAGPARGHPDRFPDHQFLCFVNTYFWKTAVTVDTMAELLSPQAWRQIATHLHWKQSLLDTALEYEKLIFESDTPPKYISVHLRHGDFIASCPPERIEKGQCFASADTIAEYVNKLRGQLDHDHISDVQVLVASDEDDAKFKSSLKAAGFVVIDHEKLGTIQSMGQWGPTIIDAVLLSRGVGFVGSPGSTYSQFAMNRVEDWNEGPTIWLPPTES